MKRYLFSRRDHFALKYSDAKMPKPLPWQILIKVEASSVNPHDWQYYGWMKALFSIPLPWPRISIGHDVSGVVTAVGCWVKDVKVGDEVYTMSAKTGAFGEYQTVARWMCAHKPESLNHLESASLPLVCLTAWQMYILFKLKEGDSILLNGASGGVGVHALQLAKIRGAHVTAVCSGRNVELVKSLGADEVIDYTQTDIHNLNQQFDFVFDMVGTINPLKCDHLVKPKGKFGTIIHKPNTFIAFFVSHIPFRHLLGLGKFRRAITVLAMPIGKNLETFAQFVKRGDLKPIIDKEYPITELVEAFEYSQTGRARGKIVLNVNTHES